MIEVGFCTACGKPCERGESGAWWHLSGLDANGCANSSIVHGSGAKFARSIACGACGAENREDTMEPVNWNYKLQRVRRATGVEVSSRALVCKDCMYLLDHCP